MEYQALPEFAQMHVLEDVLLMVLNAAMLVLVLTLGCIACLCTFELRQPRPIRSRPREIAEAKDRALAAYRLSTL